MASTLGRGAEGSGGQAQDRGSELVDAVLRQHRADAESAGSLGGVVVSEGREEDDQLLGMVVQHPLGHPQTAEARKSVVVGKECGSTWRSRGVTDQSKKK